MFLSNTTLKGMIKKLKIQSEGGDEVSLEYKDQCINYEPYFDSDGDECGCENFSSEIVNESCLTCENFEK